MATIPASSREYLHIHVPDGGPGIEAEIAVVLGTDEPAEADWKSAAWDADGSTYKALIGPTTALHLPPGIYTAWIRISADPEQPVRRSGPIRIGP